jgi:hypothetical protein
MRRLVFFTLLFSICSLAQTRSLISDPLAVSLAQRSVAALTNGSVIRDVTLTADVTSVLGSENERGSGTFAGKGATESRVDLSFTDGRSRSDVRNVTDGRPSGAWQTNDGKPQAYAGHNCWADPMWFFPALSSLSQTANPRLTFKYIGQEQHGGVNTEHIRVLQASKVSLLQRLSAIDFYLDPASSLPLAIAFQVHPDSDAGRDIAAEVRFADYHLVNGVLVPFSIQRMLSGTVILDLTITTAVFNSGLQDSSFNLE